jgi:MFS family permease
LSLSAPARGISLAILVLCLGHIVSNAVRTIPAIAVDVLTRDLGITAETLAQLTGVFPFAFAAVMVPVGVALDRYGVKRVSLTLLLVAGGGALLAAAATGVWSMMLAQAVLGAGCSGMLMCPVTFAARGLSTARFAVWSGVIQAVGNTGMLLSASPLAALIEAVDWRAGYLACAVIAALAIPAVLLAVPNDRPQARPARSAWQDARGLVRMAFLPGMRGVMIFALASFSAVLGLRGLWGGPWLMEVKGLDRLAAGNVLLACTLALTAGPALAGLVLRRVGHAPALLAGSHLVSAGLILLLLAGGPAGPFGALPIWWDTLVLSAFGLIISFQVLGFSIVRAAVPPEQAGRALSAVNVSFFLGAALLQSASGVMAGWAGVGAALATFAVALVLCTAGFWALTPGKLPSGPPRV